MWPVPRLPGVGRSTDPSQHDVYAHRNVRSFDTIQTMPPDVTAHATCTPLRPSVDGVLETSAPGVSRPCTTGNTRAEDMGDRALKIPFDFVFPCVVGRRERAPSRDLKNALGLTRSSRESGFYVTTSSSTPPPPPRTTAKKK